MESDYWNALDQRRMAERMQVEPSKLGMTTHPFKQPLAELKAKAFIGTPRVEIVFAGKEKGSIQSGWGPEMVGKTERETIRELAKINDIQLTTHATLSVGGFSGLTQHGFSEEEREKALFEVKRTVDFAADAAQGGPVVVHTGEFPRSIYREGEKFEAYKNEKERRIHYLVDSHTGAIIKDVREDEVIFEPRPMKDEKDNIIYQRDPYTGKDRINPVTKEKIPQYALDEQGNLIIDKLRYDQFREKLQKEAPEKLSQAPKFFLERQQRIEIEHAAGQAEQYEIVYKEALAKKKALEQGYEDYKKIPEKEKRKQWRALGIPEGTPKEEVDKFFQNHIRKLEKEINYGREIAISSRRQAEKLKEVTDRAELLDTFGVRKSAETIARAALYAYDVEKKRGLQKPLFIAPENIFPESYGSHPQELKTLVLKSRDEMIAQLKDPKGRYQYSEEDAKKIAKEHIKATFDIGHANTWKKYFQGTEEEFNSWLKSQVSQLTKEGIIGHVHVTDNFGYYDEHLAPGEGSAPIQEFAKELEKQGYKGPLIVEGGPQPEGEEYTVLTEAFRTLQSPIYRIDGLSQTWSDIQHSYFARTSGTPSYLVGEEYVPSKDWTLWTEAPLE